LTERQRPVPSFALPANDEEASRGRVAIRKALREMPALGRRLEEMP
jgi:hypothetical protein